MTTRDIVSRGGLARIACRSGRWGVVVLFAVGPAIAAFGSHDAQPGRGAIAGSDAAKSAVAKADVAKTTNVALPPELAHIAFSGGDGSSCNDAVVIEHARNVAEGLAAQKAWLVARYPQARILVKAQSGEKGRFYETVELQPKDGARARICFDITGFFGRS